MCQSLFEDPGSSSTVKWTGNRIVVLLNQSFPQGHEIFHSPNVFLKPFTLQLLLADIGPDGAASVGEGSPVRPAAGWTLSPPLVSRRFQVSGPTPLGFQPCA